MDIAIQSKPFLADPNPTPPTAKQGQVKKRSFKFSPKKKITTAVVAAEVVPGYTLSTT